MSFQAKYLTQGGQMTAYRLRMFIQVNNWIGYWIAILFFSLSILLFYWMTPQETLDNGLMYWFAETNESISALMPKGSGRYYSISYLYEPTGVTYTLKMTLSQMLSDPYMKAMGERLFYFLKISAMASGVFSLSVFTGMVWYVGRLGKKESEDEYISGYTLSEKPKEVNKLLKKSGDMSDLRIGDLHMVRNAEVMNFLAHGTIGVGKSTVIRWLLDYIRRRGDRAIIYDSGCTFVATHYRPATDKILSAHDHRCENWSLWRECVDSVDYDNMAASMIPQEGDSDPFWVASSRTIFSDLAIRMSVDKDRSIEKFLKTLLSLSMKSLREFLANTPSANLVEEKIEKTAISIRSVVTNYAKALRYLQGLDKDGKPEFTIREWMTNPAYDNSWLFISTQARHRKSVRPLISMWISLATLYLQSMGENSERRVWFVLDEITSLQRIPELAETLAEARKFGGCFLLGTQNMAQLVHVYGQQLAKSIFDLLNTRIYGRSPSAEMAKLVEGELGNQRRKEAREQNSYGLDQVRDGVSLGKDKVNQPVVDYEQIMRLPNLSFYVRLPGEWPVVKLKLKYRQQKKLNQGLIERDIKDVLSPELERLVRENEQAASAAGIIFPTGDEILETSGKSSAVATSGERVAPSQQTASGKGGNVVASNDPTAKPGEADNGGADLSTKPTEDKAQGKNIVQQDVPVPVPTVESEPIREEKLSTSNVVSLRPMRNAPLVSTKPTVVQTPEQVRKAEVVVTKESGISTPVSSSKNSTDVTGSRALAILNQLRKPVPANVPDDSNDDAGETLNLDVVIKEGEGGLSIKTATAGHVSDKNQEPETNTKSARKAMAEEEVNILHHRNDDEKWAALQAELYADREPDL